LDDPDTDVNPLDAPAGIVLLRDEGRWLTITGDGFDGGLNGAAGRGKHGAGSVCMAGLGFATG
jgi:hypothetical protein